jgi:hypothetical protein
MLFRYLETMRAGKNLTFAEAAAIRDLIVDVLSATPAAEHSPIGVPIGRDDRFSCSIRCEPPRSKPASHDARTALAE